MLTFLVFCSYNSHTHIKRKSAMRNETIYHTTDLVSKSKTDLNIVTSQPSRLGL